MYGFKSGSGCDTVWPRENPAMPRFAANLSMLFAEYPFAERFAAAAKAGFTAVEFHFPYDYPAHEIKRWLRDAGLINVLFNMPPGDWAAGERGIASLPGREQEFRDGVQQALDYALGLGTPNLLVMSGVLPEGAERELYRRVFLENLRYAARRLAEHGLTMLIEPINQRDMPGIFLETQREAHAIRQELGEPNCKVLMDFYHAQMSGGDLSTTLVNNFQGIGHIQIANVPGRHEPDIGEINYPYLFQQLDALGYEAWVGCEYRPRAGTEHGLFWLKELQ